MVLQPIPGQLRFSSPPVKSPPGLCDGRPPKQVHETDGIFYVGPGSESDP
jgi:hypothetical protein